MATTRRTRVKHGAFHRESRAERQNRHYAALEKFHDDWTPVVDKRAELAHLKAAHEETLTEHKLKRGRFWNKQHAQGIVNDGLATRLSRAEAVLNTAEDRHTRAMKATWPLINWRQRRRANVTWRTAQGIFANEQKRIAKDSKGRRYRRLVANERRTARTDVATTRARHRVARVKKKHELIKLKRQARKDYWNVKRQIALEERQALAITARKAAHGIGKGAGAVARLATIRRRTHRPATATP